MTASTCDCGALDERGKPHLLRSGSPLLCDPGCARLASRDLWHPTRDEREEIWNKINESTASRGECMSLVYAANRLADTVLELRAALEDAITDLESQQAMPDDSTRHKYEHLFIQQVQGNNE